MRCALVACVVLAAAALSTFLAAPAPAYDPTSWLLWGREIADWRLDTAEGPAFKPLPVAVAVALAPTGSAAPWLFVVLARAAALAALPLAFVITRRLGGGSTAAGFLGVAAVVSCTGAIALGAAGMTEGAVVALALGALEAARRERHGVLLACVTAASLLRIEAWPALAVVLILVWRRGCLDRRIVVGIAILVPAAWFAPEMLGSGDLLRSGTRARMSEPGQPARAAVPFVASLRAAVGLVAWPLLVGAALVVVHRRWRPALAPVAAGTAWIVLVALMAQAGFSGEARYALPGASLVAVGGAAGLALLLRELPRRAVAPSAVALCALVIVAALPAVRDARTVPARQAHAHALHADLAAAVRAQGRGRLLACGRPYVGRLRGPMLAYALRVHRREVEPDDAPRAPAVVFRSALREGGTVLPAAPRGWARLAAHGAWELRVACELP